jgi:hypothetical protein
VLLQSLNAPSLLTAEAPVLLVLPVRQLLRQSLLRLLLLLLLLGTSAWLACISVTSSNMK